MTSLRLVNDAKLMHLVFMHLLSFSLNHQQSFNLRLVVLQNDLYWSTKCYDHVWVGCYMGDTQSYEPVELVLKYITKSWNSYVLIEGIWRHTAGSSCDVNLGWRPYNIGVQCPYMMGPDSFLGVLKWTLDTILSELHWNLWKLNGYDCIYISNLVNEPYNWNNIQSFYSVCC